MEEIWKGIPGYEGLYEASNFGAVRSKDRVIYENNGKARPLKGKVLIQSPNPKGYPGVGLSKNGKVDCYRTHRIIAELFVSNPFKNSEVNHLDENKTNNRADNLEWCTRLQNIHHGTGMLRKQISQTGAPNYKNRGEGCGTSKLKNHQVIAIYNDPRKYKEISKEYGVSPSSVCEIKNKKVWCELLQTI